MSDNRTASAHSWRPARGYRGARRPSGSLLLLVLGAFLARAGSADVVETEDREGWFGAAGPVTTIGFTGFPENTIIANQYAKLGVLFTDGNDQVLCCDYTSFPQDGVGLDGNGPIHLVFSDPQRWIAADFPGALSFQLFSQGALLYESTEVCCGKGNFLGVLSTTPFDAVTVQPSYIDDLHFGGLRLGDLDADGIVGVPDLLELLAAWGPCPAHCPAICVGDLDGDETLGLADVIGLLAAWGLNPGHLADLDLDGEVGVIDLLTLLGSMGPCPVLFPPTCSQDLDGDCVVGAADLLTMLTNWGGGL